MELKDKLQMGVFLSFFLGWMIGFPLTIGHYAAKPKQESYNFRRIKVEQVFKDHNGLRLHFKNQENQLLEKKYLEENQGYGWSLEAKLRKKFPPAEDILNQFKDSDLRKRITIYRDLTKEENSHALELSYDTVLGNSKKYVLELHFPTDGKMKVGIDEWNVGLAYPWISQTKRALMKEIR